jgi:O-methyltransferase
MLKRLLRSVIRRCGYDLFEIPDPGAPSLYGRVLSKAQYTPWDADADFQAAYEAIRPNTKVDALRCYELWQLVEQAAKLDGAILEVGVWRGGTTALMAKRAALCGYRRPIYAADTFAGVVKSGPADGDYRNGEYADASRQDVERLAERLGASRPVILEGVFPDETAHLIPSDERLALVHIDVDVYRSAKDCVEWAWPSMVAGGLVVFDDYGSYAERGITQLVNEWATSPDRIMLYNVNGHGILLKR